MLSREDWNGIRGYTDQVCNREADDIRFAGGRVRRLPGNSVAIVLESLELDLEPLSEYDDPACPTDGRLVTDNHPAGL